MILKFGAQCFGYGRFWAPAFRGFAGRCLGLRLGVV